MGHRSVFLLSVITILAIESSLVWSQTEQENIARSEVLADYFKVDWNVNFKNKTVTFEVVAKTTGYVGFGFSPNGGMKGADLIIGGVFENGTTYFDDRFASGNTLPAIDEVQNWELISAKEDKTTQTTTLKFVRNFATCDLQDLEITEDTTHLIFSIGKTDNLEHHDKRGTKTINLLSPPNPPVNVDKFNTWDIVVNTTLPNQDTAYWCTVHKAPKFEKKTHIVGFSVMLDNEDALKYTHHLVLHRCFQPEGEDLGKIMDPWLEHEGGECYEEGDMSNLMRYCNAFFYVWAKGGEPLLLPEHVGFPVGEDVERNEYFILEIHYDNPEIDKDVSYETGVTVYHTYDIRQHDAGLLSIIRDINPSLLVPKDTSNFTIVGHCSSECTQDQVPEDGINVFNALLHAHLDGRKLTLRHFRNGTELPWLAFDGNYDFNYQQNRGLRNEVKVKKGDHLSFECNYDSTWKKVKKITLGGLSTHDEMCEAFVLYYPVIKTLDVCASTYHPLEKLYEKFGIKNTAGNPLDPTITDPPEYANMLYSELLNEKINWTKEFTAEIQQQLRYDDHFSICYSYSNPRPYLMGNSFLPEANKPKEGELPMTRYPKIDKAYAPPVDDCSAAASLYMRSTTGTFALIISTIAFAFYRH